jgi:glycosyltransferase involved in cell wall biosynthesis
MVERLRVSVIVPTRDRSALLAVTLRSVLRQQHVALEVIVIDEASTDDTPALLAAINDPRLRVIRHETTQGLPAARNHGAEHARGEWLAFVDDDDLWAPDKLVRQLQAAQDIGRDWAYTGTVNFTGHRILHGEPPPPPDQVMAILPHYNAIPGGGSNVIICRSMWLRTGPFETRFLAGGEDWEMSIRLAKQGPPAWVCSPLVAKQLHATNMTLDIAEIVRAAKLIEVIHNTSVDWGKMHRWMAYCCLRGSGRRAALGHFVRAAVMGQRREVASDLGAILHRTIDRIRKSKSDNNRSGNPWIGMAAAWLREFGIEPQ